MTLDAGGKLSFGIQTVETRVRFHKDGGWRIVWMFHAATGRTLYHRASLSEEGILPTSVKCHVAQSTGDEAGRAGNTYHFSVVEHRFLVLVPRIYDGSFFKSAN